MSKFREIRERAIANGMVLLTQDEILEETANRRSGMSEKQTTHNYDFRQFTIFGRMYFWGRTDSTTDVLDEDERMLFNIPFVAEERDVRMALFGYLERDLRDFAKGAKK